MKKQLKKLILNKETLRDLTAHKAGEVKGGGSQGNKKTYTRWKCVSYSYCPTMNVCPTKGCV